MDVKKSDKDFIKASSKRYLIVYCHPPLAETCASMKLGGKGYKLIWNWHICFCTEPDRHFICHKGEKTLTAADPKILF